MEGNSRIHHQQPLCPANTVLCPSQRADLETSRGSLRGKLRTTNTLNCLSPKARDDKTPFKTNLWVEGWSCTRAANKIHKEGPILKASEEAGPLTAKAPRSWRKANTRLCKYEMTTEGKHENANPKQTQDVRCSRMQSIRCCSHTYPPFLSVTGHGSPLAQMLFQSFEKSHWSEANWNYSLPSTHQRRKSCALKYVAFHPKCKAE